MDAGGWRLATVPSIDLNVKRRGHQIGGRQLDQTQPLSGPRVYPRPGSSMDPQSLPSWPARVVLGSGDHGTAIGSRIWEGSRCG